MPWLYYLAQYSCIVQWASAFQHHYGR